MVLALLVPLRDAPGSVMALADEAGAKVSTYAYSPRGVHCSFLRPRN